MFEALSRVFVFGLYTVFSLLLAYTSGGDYGLGRLLRDKKLVALGVVGFLWSISPTTILWVALLIRAVALLPRLGWLGAYSEYIVDAVWGVTPVLTLTLFGLLATTIHTRRSGVAKAASILFADSFTGVGLDQELPRSVEEVFRITDTPEGSVILLALLILTATIIVALLLFVEGIKNTTKQAKKKQQKKQG